MIPKSLTTVARATLLVALLISCSSDDKATDAASSQSTMGECTFLSAGNLIPNSGIGVNDSTIWAPGIISPFGSDIAYAKSQVYNPGGSNSNNPDQCASSNFNYPHRDTFCELRFSDRDSYNCPSRRIHQGIDINAGSPEECRLLRYASGLIAKGASPELADIIPVRAVTDGVISYIGSYTVDLSPSTNQALSKFRYLHLNMRTLKVEFGDSVKQGDVIGYYYNDFGGTPTTFHLHLELIAFIDGRAQYVSPYMSFIRSEELTRNMLCQELG